MGAKHTCCPWSVAAREEPEFWPRITPCPSGDMALDFDSPVGALLADEEPDLTLRFPCGVAARYEARRVSSVARASTPPPPRAPWPGAGGRPPWPGKDGARSRSGSMWREKGVGNDFETGVGRYLRCNSDSLENLTHPDARTCPQPTLSPCPVQPTQHAGAVWACLIWAKNRRPGPWRAGEFV
jgi:hypothetical protein